MKFNESTHFKTGHLIGIGLVFGAIFCFVTPFFLEMVVILGRNIPKAQEKLVIDHFQGVLWAIVVGSTIFLWPVSLKHKQMLVTGWFIKVSVTLGAVLLYEYKYDIDGIGYFYFSPTKEGRIPFDTLFSLGRWGMAADVPIAEIGTWNLYKFILIHNLYLPNNYHGMKITFSMFGLIGSYFFFRAAVRWFGIESKRYFYIILFFPSFLFWTSLISKDPIFYLFAGIYTYGVLSFSKTQDFKYVPIALLGVLGCMYERLWSCLYFVPPLVFLGLCHKKRFVKYVWFIATAILTYTTFTQVTEHFRIGSTQDMVGYATYRKDVRLGVKEYAVTPRYAAGISGVKEVLKESVKKIPYVLFRPLPGDINNLFGILAGLENLFLLTLLIISVYRTKLKELMDPIVLWAISVVAIWAGINGLMTDNLGALVRWKIQVLPIFLGLLIHLARKRPDTPKVTSHL